MNTDELKRLMAATFPEGQHDFRPCAFFDERLDCIRVIARDCSVYEERVSDRLTILVDNYPGPGRREYVGFTLKGARHFCKQHGWDLTTSIKMSELIDAIVASCPEHVVQWAVNIVAKPIVYEAQIERVEIPATPMLTDYPVTA